MSASQLPSECRSSGTASAASAGADNRPSNNSEYMRIEAPVCAKECHGPQCSRPRHVVQPASTTPLMASLCTPATARPDGSAIVAKLASHAIAAGEEQAIDLPPGTVSAAAGLG